MKRLYLLMIALVFSVAACDSDSPTSVEQGIQRSDEGSTLDFAAAGLPGHATVLRLVGTGVAYDSMVPDIDGDGEDDGALCFDIDLLDASGRIIGTATDCLSEITSVDGGLALVGTTIFNMANGTFMSRGNTTVQPLTTTEPSPASHTTGAIPMPGTNGVLSGSGAYRNLQAEVRLSGAVNLTKLESMGEITFDCLFSVRPLSNR